MGPASPDHSQAGLALFCKQTLDRSVAICALAILFPVLVVMAFMIWIDIGSPIFFRQTRPGKNGVPFTIYKFRTMNDATDDTGRLLPDNDRLTALGKRMRSLSLDELPQFFNVAKGELSLVGPRPLLMQYLKRYSPQQARRLQVCPGVTGWAQINGRNAISWEEKLALDVWYVEHWSFFLDLKILAKTFLNVFQRKGISSEGHATMPEFMGQSAGLDPLVHDAQATKRRQRRDSMPDA